VLKKLKGLYKRIQWQRPKVNNMQEIWKNIEGFNEHYQISNFGNIKSCKFGKERIMSQINNKGYKGILLCKKYFQVHRLVALHFLINKENKPIINHKNGVKSDNNVDNLEWCTASENASHAYKIGLTKILSGNEHKMYGRLGGKSNRARIVLDLETGIFYDCIKDACYAVGVSYANFKYYISNKNNFRFLYT